MRCRAIPMLAVVLAAVFFLAPVAAHAATTIAPYTIRGPNPPSTQQSASALAVGAAGQGQSAQQAPVDQKGLWASIAETLGQIKASLSISHLLDEFRKWFIDVMTLPVRALFTGVFGTLLVVTPVELVPLVTGPHKTAVAIAVMLLAAGMVHLAWLILSGREKPGAGNPEGKPRVALRAGMLVLAAVMGAVSLRVLDIAVLAHNVAALNIAIAQGIVPDPPPPPPGPACKMPTKEPDLSAPEAWAAGVRDCGTVLIDLIFGAAGDDLGGLKSIGTAGVFIAPFYGLLFFAIGALLFLRGIVLWLLAIGAPVWYAIAVAHPDAAIGWVAVTLRTLFAPWVFLMAVMLYHAANGGAFAGIGAGGAAEDLSGGGGVLISLAVFGAALAAFVWVWLLPTLKAALAPATLAGGAVIASAAGVVGKAASVAALVGALGSGLPGVGGASAAFSAGAARVAAGARAAQEAGERMRDAARDARGKLDRNKAYDYWRKAAGGVLDRAASAAQDAMRGHGDAPVVERVTRTLSFARLSEHLTETDAAAAGDFLAKRGVRRTERGYDAEAVARAVSGHKERFLAVTDPATGAVVREELSAVFGAPGHMRREITAYLQARGIGSARVVPDDPAGGAEGGVAVSVGEEAAAAAMVADFWATRVLGEAESANAALIRVSCAPDQMDELVEALRTGLPQMGLGGIPEGVIRKAVVEGHGELLIPVEYADRVERLIAMRQQTGIRYWTAGPGRYVVLANGLPVVTGIQPENGRNMGRWTGRMPEPPGQGAEGRRSPR